MSLKLYYLVPLVLFYNTLILLSKKKSYKVSYKRGIYKPLDLESKHKQSNRIMLVRVILLA